MFTWPSLYLFIHLLIFIIWPSRFRLKLHSTPCLWKEVQLPEDFTTIQISFSKHTLTSYCYIIQSPIQIMSVDDINIDYSSMLEREDKIRLRKCIRFIQERILYLGDGVKIWLIKRSRTMLNSTNFTGSLPKLRHSWIDYYFFAWAFDPWECFRNFNLLTKVIL